MALVHSAEHAGSEKGTSPMSDAAILLAILGALLIGVISPGPSFVLVSRIAVTTSRLDGLAAAIGMGVGGTIFGSLALAGLTAILLKIHWLYFALRIAGGAYLAYLGLRIWQGATQPFTFSDLGEIRSRSRFRSFSFALVTQLSNPKTAVIYASVFAALLPPSPSFWFLVALPPLIFMIETTWYAIVACAFSAKGPRDFYVGCKGWIDRIAGTVMGALGLRLISESLMRTP